MATIKPTPTRDELQAKIAHLLLKEMGTDVYGQRWRVSSLIVDSIILPLGIDNPEMDATDFAHPAWWRGEAHATQVLVKKVNDILDGEVPLGTSQEPWESLRKRLAKIVWKLRYFVALRGDHSCRQ